MLPFEGRRQGHRKSQSTSSLSVLAQPPLNAQHVPGPSRLRMSHRPSSGAPLERISESASGLNLSRTATAMDAQERGEVVKVEELKAWLGDVCVEKVAQLNTRFGH